MVPAFCATHGAQRSKQVRPTNRVRRIGKGSFRGKGFPPSPEDRLSRPKADDNKKPARGMKTRDRCATLRQQFARRLRPPVGQVRPSLSRNIPLARRSGVLEREFFRFDRRHDGVFGPWSGTRTGVAQGDCMVTLNTLRRVIDWRLGAGDRRFERPALGAQDSVSVSFERDIRAILGAFLRNLSRRAPGCPVSTAHARSAVKGGDHGAAIVPAARIEPLFRRIAGSSSVDADDGALTASRSRRLKRGSSGRTLGGSPPVNGTVQPQRRRRVGCPLEHGDSSRSRNYWAFKLPEQAPVPMRQASRIRSIGSSIRRGERRD